MCQAHVSVLVVASSILCCACICNDICIGAWAAIHIPPRAMARLAPALGAGGRSARCNAPHPNSESTYTCAGGLSIYIPAINASARAGPRKNLIESGASSRDQPDPASQIAARGDPWLQRDHARATQTRKHRQASTAILGARALPPPSPLGASRRANLRNRACPSPHSLGRSPPGRRSDPSCAPLTRRPALREHGAQIAQRVPDIMNGANPSPAAARGGNT